MMVRLVLPDEYFVIFGTARNIYGSRAFHSVTAPNAEAVRHFVGFDDAGRPRLGVIAGYRGGEWLAPYSAPFTEIAYNKPQHLEQIYDFASELTDTLGAPLRVSLPPAFYDPEMLPRITGIFNNLASTRIQDFDYYYPLERAADYTAALDHAARKNYRRACAAGFGFSTTDDPARAYAVIKANRDARGYPLAMSLEQVRLTAAAVGADFFMLTLGGADVAAAMVYRAAPSIAQVIYWGDAPGYSELRPMNMLPPRIFSHYAERGFAIVDVGPSSTMGMPNTGLCRFKESIGCLTALKPTFVFK